jgi:type I restriction enzyme M protein
MNEADMCRKQVVPLRQAAGWDDEPHSLPASAHQRQRRRPPRRDRHTKTAPIQFEEFAVCQAWWIHREENERAWKVSAAELLANNCNLDRKNPRGKEDIAHLPPEQIAASILEKEQRIAEIMGRIQKLLAKSADS